MRVLGLVFSQLVTTGGAASAAGAPPMQALWSALGGGTVAGVLLLWVRSEKDGRKDSETERREVGSEMLKLYKADTEHKVVIRQRLDSNDKTLEAHGKLLERMADQLATLHARSG